MPRAGDAGAHAAVQRRVEAVVLLQFLAHHGTRPDQAHVAHEHVPELGQLVQAGLADEAAELGDARVVLELERGIPFGPGRGVRLEQVAQHLFGVGDHRAELEALELASATAHAGVLVDGGAARGHEDQCPDDHEEPPEEREEDQRPHDVHRPFEEARHSPLRRDGVRMAETGA